MDAQLRPIHRLFLYLPLEHSESADDQAWYLDLARTLWRQAAKDDQAAFEEFTAFAEAHKKIIDRFGRFPHRNAILERRSSPEELAFLEQPGSS
ncbi:MAG: DUF924 family protein, partial [Wenzhouxiangellaceae bacterium]|nr:DUF924 family protein [Wenzhouxiangellaceae bacterium]